MCECVREYVRCVSAVSYQQSHFIVEQVHSGDAVRLAKAMYLFFPVMHPNTCQFGVLEMVFLSVPLSDVIPNMYVYFKCSACNTMIGN